MNITEIVVTGLSAGGVGAILASIVTGLFSKRKLGAEATEIITKAAAGVVTNLEAENARQAVAMQSMVQEHAAERAEFQKRLEAMAEAHVAERREWQRVLQLHVAWDAIAIAELAKGGVDLPPAPPVLPAQQFVDEQGRPR